MSLTNHTKPFLLNLANIEVIYATPEWLGTDQYFMQAIEDARGDGSGVTNPTNYYFKVTAPDYDPTKASHSIEPGRDLARQYADNFQWDQHQNFVTHTKRRHSRKISIKSANQKDQKRYPKLSDLIQISSGGPKNE